MRIGVSQSQFLRLQVVWALCLYTAAALAQPPSAVANSKLQKLSANVTAISILRCGAFVVTLDNGQVWEQNQAEGPVFPDVGDAVTIEPGKLGSYFLTARGRWTKVYRVR